MVELLRKIYTITYPVKIDIIQIVRVIGTTPSGIVLRAHSQKVSADVGEVAPVRNFQRT